MKMNISQIDSQVERIKRLIPEGESAREYLKEILQSLLKSNEPISMGITISNGSIEDKRRLASTLITIENIDNTSKISQRPEGIVDLYTIEWLLRPALPIVNGIIEKLPDGGVWKEINGDIFLKESKAVCRIDLSFVGHLGTGFLISQTEAHYIVATNAHVIEGAIARHWLKYDELKLRCSFNVESNCSDLIYYELDRKFLMHNKLDIGFLYLRKENADRIGDILKISEFPPRQTHNLKIGLIGHPSFNSNIDPFPKIFGFGGEFGIKRLSFGCIKELSEKNWRNNVSETILHDASTLSGSSGSCIIDLETKLLLGIHFGGWPKDPVKVKTDDGPILAELFEANGAIPLWTLREDEFFMNIFNS